ncbi:Rv0340 family IniB-related protein [Mycolicibacterium stellerae]|uniref:Rv0340 family IniB-related protein n=1 Tax=Mycolicibacterium stellerae TaxID=2358193 RepID=UPI000F0B1949|nr:IniB N-terminal domain-containing protein [Mycolicibacterium stellerae]
MANPLLDFVMSLVRDPDAAAHYAADPAQAIHAANLTDVTSADVNALIPVVSESLSTAVPSSGTDLLDGDAGGNVWSSGAATAAFDAFDDHASIPTIDDGHSLATNVIQQPDDSLHAGLDALHDADVPAVADFDDPSAQLTGGIIDDAPLVGDAGDPDWQSLVDDAQHHLDIGDTGFDVFD